MSDDEEEEAIPEFFEIPIEETLDLHRFRPAEIADVVDAYVEAAWEKGLRELRIIHGRGVGVQRHRVHRVLARHPRVERFAEAPADRGGWGATLAWLHPPEAGPG